MNRKKSSLTLTENCGPTYDSSSDARVDFFFHITEDAEQEKTIELLVKSWECNSLDTLRLIAFLRDCRNGKGIRRQYQMCMYWLFDNHFNTLVANIDQLVSFGYWKDLLHLLVIQLFDGLIPEYMVRDDGRRQKTGSKIGSKDGKKHSFPIYDRIILRGLRKERQKESKERRAQRKTAKRALKASTESNESVVKAEDKTVKKDIGVENMSIESTDEGVMQTVLTRAEALQQSRRNFAQNHYDSDEKYQKLFDKIVDTFAQQLKTDFEKMSKNVKSISLAGKWAPSNGHHFDKYLGISQAIGQKLVQLLGKSDISNDPKLVSEFYQKSICAPLRKYLKIPEVYMSAKLWSEVDYNRVASKCMQKNKSVFIKHDKERFEEFLASKKTVAGAVLKPIELVERAFKLIDGNVFKQFAEENENQMEIENTDEVRIEMELLEKQWLSLCEDIQKKGGGLMDNAMAVCDVSGSMNGEPVNAAIGLTILVMYLSREPWNSMCITFSEEPELHVVDPKQTFIEKLKSIKEMKWGYNTNLNRVFKLLLDKGIEQRLTNEQMPKLLLVFTDMEFDSAFPGTSLTNFEAAKQLFETNGYKLCPIVFWNLRSNTSLTSTPVQTNEMGTVLLSGYSGQQLSLIMKCQDVSKMSPYSMMRSAIDHKRYSNLRVVD